MARYVGSLPPVVLPVDRVTLHEWVWRDDQYGEAVEALQRQEYGPVVAGLDVTGVDSGSVSFPAHRGAAACTGPVLPMRWSTASGCRLGRCRLPGR